MRINFWALLFIGMASSAASAQVLVGNGGDLIECRSEPGATFEGLYSLDFVASYESGAGMGFFEPLSADPLETIKQHLLAESPAIGASFKEFVEAFKSQYQARTPNRFAKYIWYPQDRVPTLSDEYLYGLIPDNCKDLASQKVQVIQAVQRIERGNTVGYNYVIKLLDQIDNSERILQLSHLIVHEWLWSFAPNAAVIRDANRLIHSHEFLTLRRGQIREALERTGLVFNQDTLPRPSYPYEFLTPSVEQMPPFFLRVDQETGLEVAFKNTIRDYFLVRYVAPIPGDDSIDWHYELVFGPAGSGEHQDAEIFVRWPGKIIVKHMVLGPNGYEMGPERVIGEIVDYRD